MTYIVALALIYLGWVFFRKWKRASSTRNWQSSVHQSPAIPHLPGGFGRRQADGPAAAPAPERPFGEDITNPDARMIPSPLLGRWTVPGGEAGDFLALEPDHIVTPSGNERVVAVRFIGEEAGYETNSNVAVVSRGADEQYSLRYFGLSADDLLVDLESMDVVRQRGG